MSCCVRCTSMMLLVWISRPPLGEDRARYAYNWASKCLVCTGYLTPLGGCLRKFLSRGSRHVFLAAHSPLFSSQIDWILNAFRSVFCYLGYLMSSTEEKNNLYMSCLLKLYGVHHILYFLLPSAGSSVSVCILIHGFPFCLPLVLLTTQLHPKYVETPPICQDFFRWCGLLKFP